MSRKLILHDASLPAISGEILEDHRDHHFRRIPARRVTGEQTALRFINETGFCAAFTAGLGLPCLREAIEGRREPALPHHIQHDRAIMMTWNLKNVLPSRRAVYYGKALGGRPLFLAVTPRYRGVSEALPARDVVSLCETGDGRADAARSKRN
jgi:hypothetical protein